MTTRAPAGGAIPLWTLAFGAMLLVQLRSALSVPLIGAVAAAGTAWRRLSPSPHPSPSKLAALALVLLAGAGDQSRGRPSAAATSAPDPVQRTPAPAERT